MDSIDKLIKGFLATHNGQKRAQGACPDAETVAAFFEGKLDEGLERQTREHFLSCDRCLELAVTLAPQFEETEIESSIRVPLNSYNRVMRLDPARGSPWEVVVNFARGVAKALKAGAGISVASPSPAEAFRGGQRVISENLVAFHKEFPPYLAEIEVEKIRGDQGEVTVSVSEKETGKPAKGLRVSLFDPDRELESYALEQGQAVFEKVRFGKYSLNLTREGNEIGRISLNMKGEGKP